MPYSANTQALSTSTSEMINGSQPYLTIDNGVTKLTTTNDLLAIELSDGTRFTPETNVSDDIPIVLPEENQTLADIKTLVPVSVNSITINELVAPPNNYWGDDDGDTVISATGKLSVNITDSKGNKISRDDTLDVCNSPYRITLSNTDSKLNTKYGMPKSRDYTKDSTTYYINPKADPIICYVRPNTQREDNNFLGPLNVWSLSKGFFVQSTEPSTYSQNFPTTGANNLHFDILAGGIDGLRLRWPSVTKGGITATMTLKPPASEHSYFNPDRSSSVRVTLTGPAATQAQQNSNPPGSVATPTLPQTFEIVGYDSNNKAVLKYGFVLKQWFVSRGNVTQDYYNTFNWCKNLGNGYRLSRVKDLTNALLSGVEGATPSSDSNHYQRNIGAGLFAEWGNMIHYSDAGFDNDSGYWTTSGWDDLRYVVYRYRGDVQRYYIYIRATALCTYP